jgi:hypothetical protein
VDQGYYVNGAPHDLTWKGLQFHLMLEGQYFLRNHPRISLGAGIALMTARHPTGADDTVTVNKDRRAVGGYGGLSASGWARGGFRGSALLGYGGFGDNGSFGGYGPFARRLLNATAPAARKWSATSTASSSAPRGRPKTSRPGFAPMPRFCVRLRWLGSQKAMPPPSRFATK